MYIVYGRADDAFPPCTFCLQAKSLLQNKGVKFEYKVIGVDISRETLIEMVGELGGGIPRSVPQIVHIAENGKPTYIGGFQELQACLTR